MNNGWSIAKLGDYISIKSGLSYKGSKIGYGDSILLGMGCVSYKDTFVYSGARPYDGNDIEEAYCVNVGDIVLATRQQSDNLPILAMPAIIPDDFYGKKVIFGTNLYKVDNNSELSNRFIFWLLKNKHYVAYIAGVKSGTAVQMVTKKNVENYKFLCPPKEQREAIADLMWTYEKIISNNNKRIKILEQMAENLYKEWFVRFRFPGHEDVEFEDGIPKGWEIKRIRDISRLINGRAYLMPELQDDGKYRIVRVGNFSGKNEWFYSDMELEDDKYCEKGDLLYKWACNFGPEIWDEEKVIYHYHIWKIIPNEQINREYMYHFLKYSTPLWLGGTNGATMVHITKESMEKKKIIIPSQSIMIEFGDIVGEIISRVQLLKEQNTNLTRQRDLLLPRLMSGKLQVK